MKQENWKNKTVTLRELRRMAYDHRELRSAFEMLKVAGLVPAGEGPQNITKVRIDTDPERLGVGYIASSAYEWDSWGPSSPTDFVSAIAIECKGSRARDLIAMTLTALGRAMAEEAA